MLNLPHYIIIISSKDGSEDSSSSSSSSSSSESDDDDNNEEEEGSTRPSPMSSPTRQPSAKVKSEGIRKPVIATTTDSEDRSPERPPRKNSKPTSVKKQEKKAPAPAVKQEVCTAYLFYDKLCIRKFTIMTLLLVIGPNQPAVQVIYFLAIEKKWFRS